LFERDNRKIYSVRVPSSLEEDFFFPSARDGLAFSFAVPPVIEIQEDVGTPSPCRTSDQLDFEKGRVEMGRDGGPRTIAGGLFERLFPFPEVSTLVINPLATDGWSAFSAELFFLRVL